MTIDDYRTYFVNEGLNRNFSLKPSDFSPQPVTPVLNFGAKYSVEIMHCNVGWFIGVSPEIERRLRIVSRSFNWERVCSLRSPTTSSYGSDFDGVKYLFESLDIELDKYRTITNTKPRSQEEYEQLCSHSIGLACDIHTFRPYTDSEYTPIRITPEHPLWPDSSMTAPKWPFKYLILRDNKDVAFASVKREIGILNDELWAMAVGVRPDYRGRGMGKTVASAATSEIVNGGGVALWVTEADNKASIKIAESLGYKRIFRYIRIPKFVTEEDTVTGI